MMNTRNKQEITAIVTDSINEFLLNKEFISQLTNKIAERIEEKLRNLEEEVKTQKEIINKLEQKVDIFQQEIDNIHQRAKVNNICVYGVAEEPNEDLLKKILEIINTKTNMELDNNDVQYAYRVGVHHENQNKPRPSIIRLSKQQLKSEIFKRGATFRGTKIYFNEDLTKYRRLLLMEAKSAYGVKNAWSFNGQIYAAIHGKKTKITCKKDLSKHINNSSLS
ncbi:unnamed protein product [Phaedon cochleariae]|uniref:Uncharacterized protein n=1 Tax=Phaedon cochleariae TaxID=80249 RepID=A0A9P0DVW4_PHACE|nr:unnamed protein product [Phaedon cochleariae]